LNPYFSRSALLLGEAAIEKLAGCRVAVAGLGGVGSFAAEALVRGGVGSLLLIDNDLVAPGNINRQLLATAGTVGKPKAELAARRALEINPRVHAQARREFLLPENIEEVLAGPLDYILDAVDTVSAKLALAETAYRRDIPIISCMGAGNKLDPTLFRVADIYETSVCPLCRVMRRELKKRGLPGLQVVYSREQPLTPAQAPEPDSAGHSKRITPGSVSFVPPVAGMIAAGVVIRRLAGID